MIWTEHVLSTFIREANLNEVEIAIMRMRVQNKSRVETAEALHCSVSFVDKAIARLKVKYDAVQKYHPDMPPRRFSAQELYMDTAGRSDIPSDMPTL